MLFSLLLCALIRKKAKATGFTPLAPLPLSILYIIYIVFVNALKGILLRFFEIFLLLFFDEKKLYIGQVRVELKKYFTTAYHVRVEIFVVKLQVDSNFECLGDCLVNVNYSIIKH